MSSTSTPAERVWSVPCFVRDPQTGAWLRDPGEVREAMIELAAILMRIGGMCSQITRRTELVPGSGVIETTEIIFRWRSYSPVQKLPDEAEQALEDLGAEETTDAELEEQAEPVPA